MATCTFAVSTADTGNTPNTSDAFTPALNDLLVVFLYGTVTVENPGVLTSSLGGGFTFTQQAVALRGTSTNSLYMFVADQLVTSATSQTVSFAPTDTATGTAMAIYRVSGMSKVGLAAVRQTAKQDNIASGTPAPAFAVAALTGNPTLGAVANATVPAAMTEPTGWTEGADISFITPDAALEVCHRDSGFTGTTVTWGSSSASQFCSLIVELDASASGVTRDPLLGAITTAGYSPTMDKGIGPGLGAATLAGLAPVVDRGSPQAVGAIVTAGLAPALSIGQTAAPGVGTATLTGLAPLSTVVVTTGVGSATFAGLAPNAVLGPVIDVPVGSMTLTGLAPSAISPVSIPVPVGTATFAGLTPTITEAEPGAGGGGPGLLVALGLNLNVSNTAFIPAPAELSFTGFVPAVGVSYSPFEIPVGTAAFTGYPPTPQLSGADQTPVMDVPTALAITGLAPSVITGLHVRFPFTGSTQGFVGTPGAGTVMAHDPTSGDGLPNGCLQIRTTGKNRNANSVWTLTTDWASLGIPANSVVTAISQAQHTSRIHEAVNMAANSSISATVLTPTGFPPIQLAASRVLGTAVEPTTFITTTGAGTSGVQLPSGGSLTITGGATLRTTSAGSPAVTVRHDNINFVVSYTAAKTIAPPTGTIAFSGHAPTVIALAAASAQPAPASLAIEGAGPTVSVQTGVSAGCGPGLLAALTLNLSQTATGTTGGGGPGLLVALGLTLEQTPLGPARLSITGYAPSIIRPITLLGSDDILSERATVVGSGNKIIAGSSVRTPGAKALAISGLAPTVVTLTDRIFAMPVTALTFTHYVPTTGIDHNITLGVGQLSTTGLAPSLEPNYVTSPLNGAMAMVGLAPTVLTDFVVPVGAGSIVAAGYQPNLQREVFSGPFAGVVSTAGYAPFVSATDSRRFEPPVGSVSITTYAPTFGIDHVARPAQAELAFDSVGPSQDIPPVHYIVDGPPRVAMVLEGHQPLSLVSVEAFPAVGSLTFAGGTPTLEFTASFGIGAGAITIEGYAPLVQLAQWIGTGVLESQRATISVANTVVIRHGTGVLQSQQPLDFTGTGAHGHTAIGVLQSGPASLSQTGNPVYPVTTALVSGPATMKSRARLIRFKPHKPPKPHRVNRYNVVLKPNKRFTIRKPKSRRPFK